MTLYRRYLMALDKLKSPTGYARAYDHFEDLASHIL